MKGNDKRKIIKWISIQLNNIPLVDRQHRQVQNKIKQLREAIDQGDILALEKLSSLYSSIKTRIEQIDTFYSNNFMDQRVKYLQSSRVLLSKLLVKNKNYVQRFETMSQEVPWKLTGQRHSTSGNNIACLNTRRQKISQNNNPSTENNKNTNKQTIKFNQLLKPKSKEKSLQLLRPKRQQRSISKRQNPIKIIHNEQKQTQLNNAKKEVTSVKARTGKKTQSHVSTNNVKKSLSPFDKSQNSLNLASSSSKNYNLKILKPQTPTLKQNSPKINPSSTNRSQNIKKDLIQPQKQSSNTLKNLSQLVFTIKMTKQEYKNFVKMKNQANQRK